MQTFIFHQNPSGKNSFRNSTDTYSIDEELQIYAVADAPIRALTRYNKNYPQDDFSALASQLFCTIFVDSVRERIKQDNTFNEDSFKACLSNANKSIRDLNLELDLKYNVFTKYDVAETVGMGAVVYKNTLYYGGLEDVYVNLLRGDNLEDMHEFDLQIMKSAKYLDYLVSSKSLYEKIDSQILKKLPKNYHWEAAWCTYLRNNPNAVDQNNQPIGFGIFTGEEEALKFTQVHKVKIQKGDHLLLFSNGMIPTINDLKTMRWFVKNVNNSFQFHQDFLTKVQKLNKGNSVEYSEKLLLYTQL